MNLPIVGLPPIAPYETSGDGVLQWARNWVIGVAGALATQGTTSSESQDLEYYTGTEQTNSGLSATDVTASPRTAIAEIRRRSGLTWDKLADLFGVTRRSVHFWASGKALNTAHEERLSSLLAAIRYVDQGSARATRRVLMTPLADDVIPFDLLAENKFDEFRWRLSASAERSRPTPIPLSTEAKAARAPLPPSERIGALQDSVHREVSKTRIARTAKAELER